METESPGKRLRVGCLGDSWVSSWVETAPDVWCILTPMPIALRAGLIKQGWDVELVVAGFPGGTAERLLDLARICRLRGLELLSRSGKSIKGDLAVALARQQIPFASTLGSGGAASLDEDLDFVVIAVGSNDLATTAISAGVIDRLFRLVNLYADRGIGVTLVSMGSVGPHAMAAWNELVENSKCINARLLLEDFVVDFEPLVAGLSESMWQDEFHLTPDGLAVYGDRLAFTLGLRLSQSKVGVPRVVRRDGDVLHVVSPKAAKISGHYAICGVNHGRLVYRKQVVGDELDLMIFFWDGRNGKKWSGWWLGPEINWESQGSARHEDVGATPPLSGWRVPPDGPVDATFSISISASEVSPNGVDSPATTISSYIRISCCQDPDTSDIVEGIYAMEGVNHGKPVYRKRGSAGRPDALVFFWDTREGSDWCGWWVAPRIGWEHPGWLRHRDKMSLLPPMTGWDIPGLRTIDARLRVEFLSDQQAMQKPTPCLAISGCQSPLVKHILEGSYAVDGSTHGRPVYRKLDSPNGLDVVVFFWDERDGVEWSGWWLAPSIGWDQLAWARHEDKSARVPPAVGWRCPVDGLVDEAMRFTMAPVESVMNDE